MLALRELARVPSFSLLHLLALLSIFKPFYIQLPPLYVYITPPLKYYPIYHTL